MLHGVLVEQTLLFLQNVSGGASVLRACTNLNSEGKRCEDGTEAAPAYPDDPRRQGSATFGDFVTSETDEVIDDQTQRMQTGVCVWISALFLSRCFTSFTLNIKLILQVLMLTQEVEEECDWNMETLDIVQEECITSAYGNL